MSTLGSLKPVYLSIIVKDPCLSNSTNTTVISMNSSTAVKPVVSVCRIKALLLYLFPLVLI
ncbi:MAG: hypothetical protein U5K53_09475 [Halanaerobiales bacterium]|nr:hypothetical protein [Halanaerobiales bacterium]